MKRTAIRTAAICSLMLCTGLFLLSLFSVVHAQVDWKAEFDAICSKTEDPMALTPAEVRSLIERCDALKPRIEKLEDSAAKVYLKRLTMCRDLFVFVRETTSK
jgi:hypothetical protein